MRFLVGEERSDRFRGLFHVLLLEHASFWVFMSKYEMDLQIQFKAIYYLRVHATFIRSKHDGVRRFVMELALKWSSPKK